MKNKNILIICAVVLVLVTLGAGTFILSKNKSAEKKSEKLFIEEETFEEISSQDLGLIATLRPDKKAIKFEITNASDIESVEYQISYTKELNGEEVPEGLIGEAVPENGELTIAYREFGTCSSGVCRYDKVTSDIKLTLKITKINGKIYQAEETVSL